MYTIVEKGSKEVPVITITDYVDPNGYCPKVEFSATYSDIGFHAHFTTYEKNPKAVATKHYQYVHLDSCVEWFINFDPVHTDKYFNFEMNSRAVTNMAFRRNRYDDLTKLTEEDAEMLDIKAEIHDDYWTIDLTVPFEFIKKHIPDYEFKKGLKHPANVYKCGDETDQPHWGCWKMVSRDKPDFHIPSYFGTMTIV